MHVFWLGDIWTMERNNRHGCVAPELPLIVKQIPTVVTGRGRGGCRGGSGNNNNNNSGRGGRGGRGVTRMRVIKTGLNKELEGNIFDLGERLSADLMRNTQIKIAQYIGSLYGGDIMGELKMKKEFVAMPPEYPQTAIDHKVTTSIWSVPNKPMPLRV